MVVYSCTSVALSVRRIFKSAGGLRFPEEQRQQRAE